MEAEPAPVRSQYPKIVFAYDLEAGGPIMTAHPVVSFGAAVVHVDLPPGGQGRLVATLLKTHRFDCYNGDNMKWFDPKTKEFWKSLDKKDDGVPAGATVPARFIDNFLTSQTQDEAFNKFYTAFREAYELAKKLGASFIPVTDCAAYDTAWIVYLCCKYRQDERPIPMFAPSAEQELLEPVDVAQQQAGMIMGAFESFDITKSSTSASFEEFERMNVRCSMHPQGWTAGQEHMPDVDSARIAFRYVQVLNAQFNPMA